MRPSVLTRKPVPWATGCPPLSDVMIETMAPFAALAIVGMSFRGGADCDAPAPAVRKIKRRRFIVKRTSPPRFLHHTAVSPPHMDFGDGTFPSSYRQVGTS